jgi:isoleucyl-tRNA synthetase
VERIVQQVLEELNVKNLTLTNQVGELITFVIKPNFAALGPKYGSRLNAIRQALAKADPAEVAATVEKEMPVRVHLDGEDEPVELLPGELVVETREREGFAVAQEGGLVVALDTQLDEPLLQEGMARDLVRVINDMRKSADFDVSDRITTYFRLTGGGANGDASLLKGAVENFGDYIRAETLSNDLVEGAAPEGAFTQDEQVGGAAISLGVARR